MLFKPFIYILKSLLSKFPYFYLNNLLEIFHWSQLYRLPVVSCLSLCINISQTFDFGTLVFCSVIEKYIDKILRKSEYLNTFTLTRETVDMFDYSETKEKTRVRIDIVNIFVCGLFVELLSPRLIRWDLYQYLIGYHGYLINVCLEVSGLVSWISHFLKKISINIDL